MHDMITEHSTQQMSAAYPQPFYFVEVPETPLLVTECVL